MTLLSATDAPNPADQELKQVGQALVKAASTPSPAYSLSGMLYMSSSGFALLAVPNALVQGTFAAMDEHGIELPPSGSDGRLNAHITVMRPEEIASLGGPGKLSERGKRFFYRLGGLQVVEPAGWPEMSHCWMLRVHSPELQALRRSYGLSSLPNEGKYEFHITVAVRRRGVLGRNEKAKGAA